MSDLGLITFDLDAGESLVPRLFVTDVVLSDFTDVFNWNTKQLFLYVVAEYETDANVSL